ncbi:MAG: hypothetical protein K6V97_03445 [Actinomycetia bacterium]|nr:hypothetical protein [Actinomycetes bacterium]
MTDHSVPRPPDAGNAGAAAGRRAPPDWRALLDRLQAQGDPEALRDADSLDAMARGYLADSRGWHAFRRELERHMPAAAAKALVKEVARRVDEIRRTEPDAAPSEPAPPVVREVWPDAPHPDVTLPSPRACLCREDGVYLWVGGEETGGWKPACGPAYVEGWWLTHPDGAVRLTIAARVAEDAGWREIDIDPSDLLDSKATAKLAGRGLLIHDAGRAAKALNLMHGALRAAGHPPGTATRVAGTQRLPDQPAAVAVLRHGPWDAAGQPVPVRLTLERLGSLDAVRPDPAAADPDAAREAISLLAGLGRPEALALVLGWAAAAHWADRIREAVGCFPPLAVQGLRGGGKTTLLAWVTRALFGGGDALSARGATRFSLLRALAAASTVPVVLDEYRTYQIPEAQRETIHDLVRRAYTATGDPRGRPDQTVTVWYPTAPVAVLGESRLADPACLDRAVAVTLAPADTVGWPGARGRLDRLRALADRLPRAAGWVWRRRLALDADPEYSAAAIRDKVRRGQAAAAAALGERPALAHAIACWGWTWLMMEGWLDGTPTPDWGETLRRHAEAHRDMGVADYVIQYLEAVAALGDKTRYPVPMALVDAKDSLELRVGARAAEDGYDGWAREHGLPRLGPGTLLQELEQQPWWRGKGVARLGGRTMTAWILDAQQLEQRYGISPDHWPSDA